MAFIHFDGEAKVYKVYEPIDENKSGDKFTARGASLGWFSFEWYIQSIRQLDYKQML